MLSHRSQLNHQRKYLGELDDDHDTEGGAVVNLCLLITIAEISCHACV